MIITQHIKDSLTNLHSQILLDLPKRPLGLSRSSLYGISIQDSTLNFISGGHSDVYQIVDNHSNAVYMSIYDVLAFVSFGWAAEVDPTKLNNTPVSELPNRQKILMVNYMFSSDGHIVTCLELAINKPESQTHWDYENNNSGLLKDSLLLLHSHKDL